MASSSEADPNTSQRLCSTLLTPFNYLNWSRAVTLAIGGKSRLGFVNGNSPMPEEGSEAYDVWMSKDQQVQSWLLNSMEPGLAEIFSYSGNCLGYLEQCQGDVWQPEQLSPSFPT